MNRRQSGFTIVEVIVVIVVIGILAAIGIVAYGNWRNSLTENQLKSDLSGAKSAMENDRTFVSDTQSGLPSSFVPSEDTNLAVRSGGGVYCLEATSIKSPSIVFSLKSGGEITPKPCGTYFTKIGSSSGSTLCGISYGKAYCWGIGSQYNLGNGSTADSPVPVAVLTDVMSGTVTDITESCAVSNGKVYCWGSNGSGQVGNGTVAVAQTPVAVNSPIIKGSITKVVTGGGHRCALAQGKAYCWGQNNYGQLGNGTNTQSLLPVAVDMTGVVGEFTDISAASQHTCGVAGGKAYCWGSNGYSPTANGQLGNGTTSSSNTPTAVTTTVMSGTVTGISTSGGATTCAVADGKAYCWGGGAGGQLGNGDTTTSLVPVAVSTNLMKSKVTEITNSCAIADGKAYCWGQNSGRLGNGTTANSLEPVAVDTTVMSEKVTSLYSYGSSVRPTCAIANGNVYCWGSGSSGILGNGSTSTVTVPTPVMQIP